MDRPLLHRRARAAQGRPQEDPKTTKALSAVPHDRLWAQVAEWLGRGWSPLLISGRLRVLWPDDALMRRVPGDPSTDGSTPAGRFGNAGARGPPRGHRRRRRRRRQEDVALPLHKAECPSPNARRRPTAGARSAIGRPSSVIGVGWNLHTEVERRTRLLDGPASFRTRPPAESGGAQLDMLDMFSPLPAGARVGQRHARHRHRVRPPRKAAPTGCAPYGPRASPTRTPAGSGEATRTATGITRLGICPNAARSGWTWQRRSGRDDGAR